MKKLFVCFVVLFSMNRVNAQDPLFLNTNQSLIYLNPSFAGSNGYIRNQLAYRNQWPNLSGSYVTYMNTFDTYIKPLHGGIAVSVLTDDQARGTLKTTCVSLAYAHHFSFRDGSLKIIPSLQGAYGTRNLDRENLHYGDAFDLRNGMVWNTPTVIPGPKKTYFDANAGLLVNYKNLYVGASVFHFNQPDIGLMGSFKLPALYSLNASYNKAISENMLLNFSGRLFHQKFTAVQGAVNLVYKFLIAGAGYRSENAGFVSGGFRTSGFTCMLGYDRTFSKMFPSPPAWELMLSFNVRKETPKGVTTNLESW